MFHFASTFPTQFLGRFRAPRAQLAPFSYLLLLIGHMQTIFEWKGDELSSSAKCGIWTQGLRHQKSPADKPTELWWIKWKKFYSTARPYEGSVGTIFIDRNRCLQYFISLQQYPITYWLQAQKGVEHYEKVASFIGMVILHGKIYMYVYLLWLEPYITYIYIYICHCIYRIRHAPAQWHIQLWSGIYHTSTQAGGL